MSELVKDLEALERAVYAAHGVAQEMSFEEFQNRIKAQAEAVKKELS